MYFLLIDTSTERGVVAIGNKESLLFAKELPFGLTQSKFLFPSLEEAFQNVDSPSKLKGIIVGKGPGSYTGIRVGVAAAQSLAFGWNIPLIGLSSLKGFIPDLDAPFASLIDARIGGVYLQKGRKNKGEILFEGEEQICSLDQLAFLLSDETYLVSPNIQSLKKKVDEQHPHNKWRWIESYPSIKFLFELADLSWMNGQMIIPPSRLEINYLRETEAERQKNQNKP